MPKKKKTYIYIYTHTYTHKNKKNCSLVKVEYSNLKQSETNYIDKKKT